MIAGFFGKYRYLSNFYIEPDETCVELEYQSAKTNDASEKLNVLWHASCVRCNRVAFGVEILFPACSACGGNLFKRKSTPGEAKRKGRKVTLRSDWNDVDHISGRLVKVTVMEQLVQNKFDDHIFLAKKLLGTGVEELHEENTWGDDFWGTVKGQGQNQLGLILMRVRFRLRMRKQAGTA